jgi:hypothetical protein
LSPLLVAAAMAVCWAGFCLEAIWQRYRETGHGGN